MESTKVIVLLITLCSTIVLVICAFTFFREDREEQITPLCPQLIVKDKELNFRLPLGTTNDLTVLDNNDPPEVVCKVSMDWPDPFRGSPHGVAATVRVHNRDMTLATVVARNVAVLGQGLALCRSGCEIFGFVEPEGPRYLVRHRTGVLLLTLVGDFENWDIEGINPVGSKVCTIEKKNDQCVGRVTQHVDAGLVICALMATHVHRKLTSNVPLPSWGGGQPGAPITTSNDPGSTFLPMPGEAPPEFIGEAKPATATPATAAPDPSAKAEPVDKESLAQLSGTEKPTSEQFLGTAPKEPSTEQPEGTDAPAASSTDAAVPAPIEASVPATSDSTTTPPVAG